MKPLYNQIEFDLSRPMDKLPCECYTCGIPFKRYKKEITFEVKNKRGRVKYCSLKCNTTSQKKNHNIKCTNCNCEFYKQPKEIKKSKTGNHFCSKSCAATYNNKHKKYGTKRSKLEVWLEEQLTTLYPKLEIHFNRKDTIGSELDIYFPTLNLAIELNGIFHYEPIYGVDKLGKIQENDKSKSKACFDAKIDLCIIDTSEQKYFKEKTSIKYLNIIIKILNERFC